MGKDGEGHGTDLSPTSISWWCLPSKDTQAVLRASGWSVTCGSSSNSSLLLLREPKTAPQRTHQQINQHSCHVTHIHTHAHAIRDEGMHRTVATAWDHLLRNHLLYHIQIKVVQVKDFCLIMKFCQSSRSGSGESGNSSFRSFFLFLLKAKTHLSPCLSSWRLRPSKETQAVLRLSGDTDICCHNTYTQTRVTHLFVFGYLYK